uniref:KRAB domain-containing protein n=1 Tax=Urocitellus parryii TaxID=9999 RepID=A0A8D2HKY4_UROPR
RAATAVRDCASVTFEDVAVGLSQEWALLDDVRRDLCRYVLLDNYQTLACRGEAGIAPFLAACVCRILPQCLPCGRAWVRLMGFIVHWSPEIDKAPFIALLHSVPREDVCGPH